MSAPAMPVGVPTVALVGNPNCGKTTLFNALTGLSQRVGNYPGVTIERKTGRLSLGPSRAVELVDLPGTYSLAARSPDEQIAVDVLLGAQGGTPPVDAVLAIVDASNLRRHLYLLSQLLELDLPVVVALNMVDLAEAQGVRVQAGRLAERLGVAVVPVCARRGDGVGALRQALAGALDRQDRSPRTLPELPASTDGPPASGEPPARAPRSAAEAGARYAWVDAVLAGCVTGPSALPTNRSDRIDRLLTHRVLGLVAFALISASVFQGIYRGAAPAMAWLDRLGDGIGHAVRGLLAPGPLQSLLVDGVVAGVGGVLAFLPQIAILFLFIALLEDSGYMARAALLMDRLLTRCGLSGKAFIPLLSCFACAVPGIMATRTIEDRRDRLTTILVAPLMGCSARLPVYALLIGAFIPARPLLGGWLDLQGVVLLALYGLGIAVAVPLAWLFRKALLRGQTPPFLMELPSYKWPSPRTVALRVYQSSRAFVVRAGGIILATTLLMWGLAYFPRAEATGQATAGADAATRLENSYLGRAGRWLEPAVRPLGWDWRIGMATLASFPAREVVVSVLGTIYSMDSGDEAEASDLGRSLRSAVHPDGRRAFGVPVALSIMVFFALCAQCMSTLATVQRETRSWAWTAFAFLYLNLLAYVGALVTFQTATWLGGGH